MRMGGRLLRAEPALIDQGLHPGMIVGHPNELAVAQPIHPRVADVDHGEVLAVEGSRRDGGAHAFQAWVVGGEVGDQLVGLVYASGQTVKQVLAHRSSGRRGQFLVQVPQPEHRHAGGEVAPRSATHAVGHE